MEFNFERFNIEMRCQFGIALPNELVMPALKIAKKIEFEKDDIILGIGKPMEKVYLILTGIARSYYLDINGNDVTKIFISEMSFCLGESFLSKESSIQGVEALENITALEFCAEELKKYLFSTELKEAYIKILEKTLLYKMRRESYFQLKSATERYLDFKREFPDIEKRVNQSYVASYLGITPVSLSRIRRTIKEEN